jgi:hypothetical protein
MPAHGSNASSTCHIACFHIFGGDSPLACVEPTGATFSESQRGDEEERGTCLQHREPVSSRAQKNIKRKFIVSLRWTRNGKRQVFISFSRVHEALIYSRAIFSECIFCCY